MSRLVFSRGLKEQRVSKEHPCTHLLQDTPAVYGACILYTASITNDILMSVLHGNEYRKMANLGLVVRVKDVIFVTILSSSFTT